MNQQQVLINESTTNTSMRKPPQLLHRQVQIPPDLLALVVDGTVLIAADDLLVQTVLAALAGGPQLAELPLLQLHLHRGLDVVIALELLAIAANGSRGDGTLAFQTGALLGNKSSDAGVLRHHDLFHIHMLPLEQIPQRSLR